MIQETENTTYEGRLKDLELFSLSEKVLQANLTVFSHLKGYDKGDASQLFLISLQRAEEVRD